MRTSDVRTARILQRSFKKDDFLYRITCYRKKSKSRKYLKRFLHKQLRRITKEEE